MFGIPSSTKTEDIINIGNNEGKIFLIKRLQLNVIISVNELDFIKIFLDIQKISLI